MLQGTIRSLSWVYHSPIKRNMPRVVANIYLNGCHRQPASGSGKLGYELCWAPQSMCTWRNLSLFSGDHQQYGDEAPAYIRSTHGHSGNPVTQPESLTQLAMPQGFTKEMVDLFRDGHSTFANGGLVSGGFGTHAGQQATCLTDQSLLGPQSAKAKLGRFSNNSVSLRGWSSHCRLRVQCGVGSSREFQFYQTHNRCVLSFNNIPFVCLLQAITTRGYFLLGEAS